MGACNDVEKIRGQKVVPGIKVPLNALINKLEAASSAHYTHFTDVPTHMPVHTFSYHSYHSHRQTHTKYSSITACLSTS